MLTPQKIQDLADPIESIYIAMTNELLVNIGRHITKPTWTHTAAWEIQKLSELGQLTQENAAIINRWIKSLPQEIRDTMEETRRVALEDIEKQMEKAANAGYLTPPERDSTVAVLQEYSQQAADQLNLVNTTMLQSSLQQYSRMVMLTAEIERQAEQTQAILNEAAGSVAVGTETRTQALNRAIQRISAEGLAGFYDRAGRSWTPEAYVNMDIRTTVHNVAIQSVKNRMEDYNTQVFQVSAHAGARPLCYPHQGKLYSWNNTAGEIETGDGRTWRYEPLNSTSYGQPAGLFGINCGHSPIPIIPGVTIPHAQDFVQPKDENDRQYAESQEQRALERKIRAAKRALEMGDDSPEAKAKVKAAQEEMRQFIKATGRTRRYDREQLYGGKKAPTPAQDQRPEKNVASQATTPTTFKDRIDLIRSNISGKPTTEQIHEAGNVLAKEYDDFLKQKQPELDAKIARYQAEVDRLTKLADDLKEQVNQIMSGTITSEAAEKADQLTNERFKVLRQLRIAEYDLTQEKKAGLSQEDTVKWLAGKIGEIREVGPADVKSFKTHFNNSRADVRKNVEYAYSHYPRDWVESSFARGQLKPKKVSRGFYSDWRGEIAISGWDDRQANETSFHELGHRFERAVAGIIEQEKEFYDRRTAGEDLKWLGRGYRKDEKTRFDQFVHPYMGKDYGGSAYELVSMGFEYAYTNPQELAKDKDMQSWIYGMLLLL